MTLEILDPTHESNDRDFKLAKPLEDLKGATIGIISNGKKGTKPFFDALKREFIEGYGAADVVLRTKLNYSAPAEDEVLEAAADWDVAIAGVGD